MASSPLTQAVITAPRPLSRTLTRLRLLLFRSAFSGSRSGGGSIPASGEMLPPEEHETMIRPRRCRAPPQHSVRAAYYRGGTSRAMFFRRQDLPADQAAWAPIFLGAIGSPDAEHGRQLDGLGGGISSLSKACVVGPPTVPDADVDYTFAALGVRDSEVDYSSNCGNMSAAVGPFAVDSGLVAVPEETMARLLLASVPQASTSSSSDEAAEAEEEVEDVNFTVRIHNTNTGKLINATFPLAVSEADEQDQKKVVVEAASSGSFVIDGVAGSAAPVQLDFVRPAGSRTGKLLPTGKIVDEVEVVIPPEISEAEAASKGLPLKVRATLIDAGNPCVFVYAQDLGVADGTMSAAAIDADVALKLRLEAVRRRAAVMMGLGATTDDVPGSIPKIGFVSRPLAAPTNTSTSTTAPGAASVIVRAMSVGQPHKAVPVTVALALAAAARLPGSVVADCAVHPRDGHTAAAAATASQDSSGIVIHHASGTLTVGAKFDSQGHLEHATVFRTARRLMEGKIFWK